MSNRITELFCDRILTILLITAPCRVGNRIVENNNTIINTIFHFISCKYINFHIFFNLLHWSVQHEIYGRALDQIA